MHSYSHNDLKILERDHSLRLTTHLLQVIGEVFGEGFRKGGKKNPNLRNDLSDRYGVLIDNDTFSMHPFCWCEKETCPYCGKENQPNFHYKPTDFKVWWYKYIGRGMEMNKNITSADCALMLSACLQEKVN